MKFILILSSAERNINISETFKLLSHLIDKTKKKNNNNTKNPDIKPYSDQLKFLEKQEKEAYDRYAANSRRLMF